MSSNNENQTKSYDGEAQKKVMRDALVNLTGFMDRNPKYWELNFKNLKANDNVIVCDNDRWFKMMLLIHATNKKSNYKLKVKDGKSVNHMFIYDKKDGIFKTKKKNRILAPHLITYLQATQILADNDEMDKLKILKKTYTEMYGEWNVPNDNFKNEVHEDRINNHTGNHYRNNFTKIPPKAYGR